MGKTGLALMCLATGCDVHSHGPQDCPAEESLIGLGLARYPSEGDVVDAGPVEVGFSYGFGGRVFLELMSEPGGEWFFDMEGSTVELDLAPGTWAWSAEGDLANNQETFVGCDLGRIRFIVLDDLPEE